MAKKTNPKLIGGFVVGAIVLLIVGALAFGGGEYFSTKQKAVLFFEGSISGLAVGSPVQFRGVKVGSVIDIALQYNVTKQEIHIPVYIEVYPEHFQIVGGERNVKNLQIMVQRGLRAQLQVQSLVTGQAVIEFEFHPDTPIVLVGGDPSLPELPTIPSSLDQMTANVSDVLKKIAALPLDKIGNQLLDLLKTSDSFVGNVNAEIKPLADSLLRTSDQADSALVEARKLIDNVNGNVDPFFAAAQKVLKNADGALTQADQTLASVQRSTSRDSPLYFQLDDTLKEIKAAAAAIRSFASYMERNPNALLTGKK